MKNKRGFTLLEVLAVIIVLAIASIVATPMINRAIVNARMELYINGTYGVARTAEHYIARKILDEEEFERNENFIDELNLSDDQFTDGEVIVTDENRVLVALQYGPNCFIKRREVVKVIEPEDFTTCDTSLIEIHFD